MAYLHQHCFNSIIASAQLSSKQSPGLCVRTCTAPALMTVMGSLRSLQGATSLVMQTLTTNACQVSSGCLATILPYSYMLITFPPLHPVLISIA